MSNHRKGILRFSILIIAIVLGIQSAGPGLLMALKKVNFFYQQYRLKYSNELIVLTVPEEDWFAGDRKEMVIDGNYYDIESSAINKDGSFYVTARKDEFDNLLHFLKQEILSARKQEQAAQSSGSGSKCNPDLISENYSFNIIRYYTSLHILLLHSPGSGMSGFPPGVFIPPDRELFL